MTTLQASQRPESGKGAARKLRVEGKIPAVLYGPAETPVPVAIDPNTLSDIFAKSQNRNTVLHLDLDGASVPVLVRDVQRHPVSRRILHVDFYRLSADRDVEVMVPLRTVGRPKGIVHGGRLRVIRRQLATRCKFDRIPLELVLDVSPLGVGDEFRVSDVPLPEGVALVDDPALNVVVLEGKKQAAGAAEGAAE